MRSSFLTLLVCLLILSGTAAVAAELWFASPDGEGGWWKGEPRAADDTLSALIKRANSQRKRSIEIRLLTDNDRGQVTPYRGRIEIRRPRSSSARLLIKGQVENDTWLTRLEGPSLRDTVCDPKILKPDYLRRCLNVEVRPPGVARLGLSPPDFLDVVLGEISSLELPTDATLNSEISLLSAAMQGLRTNCVVLTKTSHVELVDLGFRDCWLPGVFIADSQHITVRHSKFEGSSYAIAAVASGNRPNRVSHLQLIHNFFVQSPKVYQEPHDCQDPRRDLTCGVDIWAEIPWGVTHDRFWQPLNGGFFGAKNVGGPITLSRNEINNAYNGVRLKVSEDCMKKRSCRTKANVDVIIHDNYFENIRDNPIEPEVRADRWVISRNRFFNSHAWISMDGVAGGRIYIFGNRGWYDELPSHDCEDSGWEDSPQFYFWGREKGEYRIPEDPPMEEFDPQCHTHDWGTVFKTAIETPSLEGIYIFNNSWMLRSPLIRSGRAAPMHHWNNAILFRGCGELGPDICRTMPSDSAKCTDKPRHLTPDKEAYWADCFNFKDGNHFPHEFDFDAVTKGFPKVFGEGPPSRKQELHGLVLRPEEMFQTPDDGIFDPPNDSPLKGVGCVVAFDRRGKDMTCTIGTGQRPHIGAVQADGKIFRIDLPWRNDF